MMSSRTRWITALPAALVAVLALAFPGYAARLLNSADQFAVLSGSSVTATSPSGITGVVGAQTTIGGPIVGVPTLIDNGQGAVPQALADLSASRTQTAALPGTPVAPELGGGVFQPGVYHVAGNATIADGATVTLSGFGVYIFNIDGSLTVGANATVLLVGGASPANIYWNVGGDAILSANSNVAGSIMNGGLATMGNAATLLGKLLSENGPVTLGGSTIVDGVPGTAPAFIGTTPQDGAHFTVCVGDTLTYTVTGQDPDGDQLVLSAAGKPLGASHLPNDGGEDLSGPLGDDLLQTGTLVSSRFNWVPLPEDVGTYNLVYSLTDINGVISQVRVTISVSQRPAFVAPTPADGTVVTLCPGDAYSYTIAATDADPGDAGDLALEVSGAPAGMGHNPALPIAAPGAVSTDVTFTPSEAQAGQSYTVTYTATDGLGCEVSTSLVINVAHVPQFEAPTPADGTVYTVCAGETVSYQIRAADGDAGQTVNLSATGLPAGAVHLPGLPFNGNPVQVGFTWTPTPDDEGTYVITYTATDSSPAACSSQTTVTINVLRPVATGLQLVRTGNVGIDEEMCFTATVTDQCGRPLPGQTVYFDLQGTTGDNRKLAVETDAAGQARLCFEPTFPGTDTILVWAELNGNAQRDPGEPMATENVTVLAPASSPRGAVAGSGAVPGAPFTVVKGESGTFFVDAMAKKNGAVRGSVTFNVATPRFSMRSKKLTGLTIKEDEHGRSAIIFGVTKMKKLGGKIRFRVDVLDAGSPGVPNDRFVITFLTPTGNVVSGGNLRHLRTGIRVQNDVLVRVNLPVR